MGQKKSFTVIKKNIKNLFFFIFLCCSIFNSSNAEVINQIQIEGNKRVSDETIIIYGDIKDKKSFSEKDLSDILKNLYSTNFFQNINLDIKGDALIINVKEYPTINQLLILGEKSNRYKDQIIKIMSQKQSGSFIKNNLDTDIKKIKKIYSSSGYNFAKITPKIKNLDEDNVDLVIEIERGKQTKISRINFIGDKKIREKRLRDIIASEEDKFWKIFSRNTKFNDELLKLDERLLNNYYRSIGFYNVNISSKSAEFDDNNNVIITFSIDAGEKHSIDKISADIDDVFDKKVFNPLKKEFKKLIGETYSPFKVKKLLDQLDEIISDNNLQFVEHNVEENVSNNNVSIKINITEGEKVLVERINVTGNSVTNENVIRGEFVLDEGDPFTKNSLDKTVSNLKARRIFSSVKSTTKSGTNENLKIIDIDVEEQPTGEISAGAGVGTNGGTLAFTITENNWLGKGVQTGIDVQINEESLRGKISYIDPNYDFLGNSINYSVYNNKNDKPNKGYENTVVGAEIGTSFEQFKKIRTNLGLSLSYDDLKTLSNATDSLKKQKGTYSDLSGIYGFSYDNRDRTFMPTSGSIVKFTQSLPFAADKASISNNFTSSYYKSITEDVVTASKFTLRTINGISDDDVRLSKRINLPSSRLRGFERGKVGPVDGDDHIGGNFAAALNFEANLPNFLPESSKTDVGAFLDFGNVWGVDYDDSIDDSNEIRSSAGITASWNSPVGPMTFVISSNLSKANSDKTESFNFNLGTTF